MDKDSQETEKHDDTEEWGGIKKIALGWNIQFERTEVRFLTCMSHYSIISYIHHYIVKHRNMIKLTFKN